MSSFPATQRSSSETQPAPEHLQAESTTMNRGSPVLVLLQNFVFCTAIAFVLWRFVPSVGQYGFFSNFVHAQAIGGSITLLAITLARASRAAGFSQLWTNILSIGVATVLGVIIGLWLAALILGLDTNPLAFILDTDELLISAITAVLASLAFNWHLHRREKVMRLELLASEERRRADAANHAMLRAQLEPHMLFNTLANLRALIGHDTDQAISMLDRLDSFLRSTLKSSRSTWHTLRNEFEVLDDYLALMKIRMGERLHFSLQLPDDCKSITVPALILQPLVENAIRHGIEPQINGGDVLIESRLEKSVLFMTVTDTGGANGTDGRDATTNSGEGMQNVRTPSPQSTSYEAIQTEPPTEGFGLENIRLRLKQTYGDEATLRLEQIQTSAGDAGTRATIMLPVTPPG